MQMTENGVVIFLKDRKYMGEKETAIQTDLLYLNASNMFSKKSKILLCDFTILQLFQLWPQFMMHQTLLQPSTKINN